MKRPVKLLLLTGLVLAFTFVLRPHPWWSAGAQSGGTCVYPPNDPDNVGWPKGASVGFTFAGSISSENSAAATNSFSQWTTANQNNSSQVSFFQATTPSVAQITVQTCNTPGCASSNGAPAAAIVNTEEVGPPGSTVNEVVGATITIDITQVTNPTDFLKTMLHEIAHTLDIDHAGVYNPSGPCGQTPGATVMNGYCPTASDPFSNLPTSITPCDVTSVGNGDGYVCYAPYDCLDWDGVNCVCLEYDSDPPPCSCTCGGTCTRSGECIYTVECSPIIIAVGNNSDYQLTSSQAGVLFDLDANGTVERVAWTKAWDTVAFLVRDRNGNGTIDDGTELFGNYSVLPSGQRAVNGFEALAYYDGPEYGGNNDGAIDARDPVWAELQLWIDWNHNGFSESGELYRPGDFGLTTISIDYRETNRTDAFGNMFRLMAPCQLGNKVRFGYDVYFSAKPQRRPR
jgi:hypothetical protein